MNISSKCAQLARTKKPAFRKSKFDSDNEEDGEDEDDIENNSSSESE